MGQKDPLFYNLPHPLIQNGTYLNNPSNPDPCPSPEVNPVDLIDTTYLIYEGSGTMILTVEDDDGGMTSGTIALG